MKHLTALLTSACCFTAFAYYFWFICDDAFISFRYSENLANGLGLIYNYNENPPIEGYSNFIWVILAALLSWIKLDITQIMPVFSILAGIFGLYLLDKNLKKFEVKKPINLICLLTAAIFPPFFIYGTSGLETLPAAVCLFACFSCMDFSIIY